MSYEFDRGYREEVRGAEVLGTFPMTEADLRTNLEQAIRLGKFDFAGYWAGRLTAYGSEQVTLPDGTLLSYYQQRSERLEPDQKRCR